MTSSQEEALKLVYDRLIDSEEDTRWSDLDTNLEMFGWLSDEELIREAQVKFVKHCNGKIFRCSQNHEQKYCFAPTILEAASAILGTYEESKILVDSSRYVLTYYVVLSEMEMIYSV